MVGFFKIRGDTFEPTSRAISLWSDTQLDGPPVCALLAYAVEGSGPGDGHVPARLTVDFLRPVRNSAIILKSEVLRQGRRVTVVSSALMQDGVVSARGTCFFVPVGLDETDDLWQDGSSFPVPRDSTVDLGGSPPMFRCEGGDWTSDLTAVQNSERKLMWQNMPPVVEGETMTPFQRLAAHGDQANLVCHWGARGIRYINVDVTVAVSRLPSGEEVGLRADDRTSYQGISIGTAALYDRLGRLGTSVVTAIANRQNTVNLATSDRVSK